MLNKRTHRLHRLIAFSIYESDITKLELAELMEMSYPTMLKKIADPGTLKISEAEKLCNILNIQLTDLLILNTRDE